MHNSHDVKVFEHVMDSLWKYINMNKRMVMISPLNDVLDNSVRRFTSKGFALPIQDFCPTKHK